MTGKHRRAAIRDIETRWKRTVALVAATASAGMWVPFLVNVEYGDTDDDDDSVEYVVPPLLHEGHEAPSWPTQSSPKVDLTKPPTKTPTTKPPKPAPSPSSSPTYAKPTPKQTVTPAPVATKPVSKVLAFARAQIGDAYVYGGNGPNGWDCSGLTQAAFSRAGIDLPRTSQAQSLVGTRVSLSALQPGDLLFWGGVGTAYHVAVYVGGGKYIAAQNPATGVVQVSLSYYAPDFARRVL